MHRSSSWLTSAVSRLAGGWEACKKSSTQQGELRLCHVQSDDPGRQAAAANSALPAFTAEVSIQLAVSTETRCVARPCILSYKPRCLLQQQRDGCGHGAPIVGGCTTRDPTVFRRQHPAWLRLGHPPSPAARLAGHVPQRLWTPAGVCCSQLQHRSLPQRTGMRLCLSTSYTLHKKSQCVWNMQHLSCTRVNAAGAPSSMHASERGVKRSVWCSSTKQRTCFARACTTLTACQTWTQR